VAEAILILSVFLPLDKSNGNISRCLQAFPLVPITGNISDGFGQRFVKFIFPAKASATFRAFYLKALS
jgi:hypothetical protein